VKPIRLLLSLLLFCAGCNSDQTTNSQVIVDQTSIQKPEKQFDENNLPENHFAFKFLLDAMNRDSSFPTDLVIDQSYYKNNNIKRGDIILMEFTDNYLKKNYPNMTDSDLKLNKYLVSRVIGLPGEVVKIREGQVFINNKRLNTFYGYQTIHNQPVPPKDAFTMKEDMSVPDNYVFVMPDEWWRGSVNSSLGGPISYQDIKGKVVGYLPGK
jgi:signal peptidase I